MISIHIPGNIFFLFNSKIFIIYRITLNNLAINLVIDCALKIFNHKGLKGFHKGYIKVMNYKG